MYRLDYGELITAPAGKAWKHFVLRDTVKLLFAYYTHKPGGFCRRLYRALEACATAGHSVVYATLDIPSGPLTGIEVVKIPFPLARRGGLLFWALFTLWLPVYLVYLTARVRPDRLIPFGAFYSASMWLAGWLYRTPRVLFLRSLTFKIDSLLGKPRLVQCLAGAVDFLGIRSATKVVCMTRSMQRDVLQFSGRDLGQEPTLLNDVPDVGSSGMQHRIGSDHIPPHPLVCVAAGVLDARKNISILLRALSLVEQRKGDKPSIRLLVLGDGPLRPQLEREGSLLPDAAVRFLGWVPDPTKTLRDCSLLLHPALHEGVPNIVMEALGCDLPVALSDIPEHAELVSYCADIGRGRIPLLNPADAEAWVSLLEDFRDKPEVREAVVLGAQKLAEALRFDWNKRFVEIACG